MEEDAIRKLVESRRKRKYLKSDAASYSVPKRTRQHWDKAKQQGSQFSQNVNAVATCGPWEVSSGQLFESTQCESSSDGGCDAHNRRRCSTSEEDSTVPLDGRAQDLQGSWVPSSGGGTMLLESPSFQQDLESLNEERQFGGGGHFPSSHLEAEIPNREDSEQPSSSTSISSSGKSGDEEASCSSSRNKRESQPSSDDDRNIEDDHSVSDNESECVNSDTIDDNNEASDQESSGCNEDGEEVENEQYSDNMGTEENEDMGNGEDNNMGNEENEDMGNEEDNNMGNEGNENMGNEENVNMVNEEDEDGNDENEDNERNVGINDPQNPNRRQKRNHQKLRECLASPLFNENITTPVNITRNDLLYMALGLAKQNNDTNKAFNDSVKLLNAIFISPVLPKSSYLLDQLVLSYAGLKFFFFCQKCAHDFGELDFESIEEKVCPSCEAVNPISDLRIAHFFCIFDIKCQLQALLSDEEIRQSLLTPSQAVQSTREGFFTDIHSGSMYKNFESTLGNSADHVVSFQMNTDGSPLFKSSKCSIWPISLAVNELLPSVRMENLLIGGLWFGKKKPPMDLFLKPFVNHMCELAQDFTITVANDLWNMRAYVTGISVDSGARGAVQGLKTHSGYDSCSWCCIHGLYLAGAVRFPLTDVIPRERRHEDIVRMQYELVNEELQDEISDNDDDDTESLYGPGVNAVSPLIDLPSFNMVDGFFVESMHCLHLGVTKFAISKWLEDFGHEYYIKEFEEEINKRIRSLRPPIDCRRMPRTLEEKTRYKARELENFLFFCIVPVLTGILPEKYIKMWLLFAQAVYLLSLTVISASHVDIADVLLKKFLIQWQEAYGQANMTFNMHLLYHLAQHVARWGNLYASSAYCFESFNGQLKKVIRSQQGIPQQVVRSLSWQQSLNILQPHVSEKARNFVSVSIIGGKNAGKKGLRISESSVLLGKPQLFTPTEEENWLCQNEDIDVYLAEEFRKLVQNKCVFAPDHLKRKSNNSVAQLKDMKLVLIHKIILDRVRSKIFLIVSLLHLEILLDVPASVTLHPQEHLMRRIVHIEPNKRLIKCEELKIVCFRATFQHGDFVAPLPNVFNRN